MGYDYIIEFFSKDFFSNFIKLINTLIDFKSPKTEIVLTTNVQFKNLLIKFIFVIT